MSYARGDGAADLAPILCFNADGAECDKKSGDAKNNKARQTKGNQGNKNGHDDR